jgi:aryl-alcohol dehydrogenase
MKIKAAVVREKSGAFNLEDLELEEPREDEVLVRIAGAGVCHTDLACRDQYLPYPLPSVFGHEGSGVVERVGPRVSKVKSGDQVVLSFATCGTCSSCRQGREAYCPSLAAYNFGGARPDGSTTISKGKETIHGSFFGQSSFANFALANERNTVKVPDDAAVEMLGPLGCGVQTGAGAVINTLHPQVGSSIAVFACGTVGMSAILAAVVCGCGTIIAVDINSDRLKLAREFGATHTINPEETNPVEAIQQITGGGADYSLECIGNPAVFRQSVDALNVTGVCGLIGFTPMGTEVSLDMNTIMFGRTIRGIIEGDANPDLFIPTLIELQQQGRFPFDRMISYYSFDEIAKAVADLENGRVLKPVLRP